MQFHIPQYVELEDKIFGPLTFKQGVYLAGGAGTMYLVFRLLSGYIYISGPIIIVIAILTWALAFYPTEKLGKPFVEILQAAISYAFKNKLYTWKKTTQERKVGEEQIFIRSIATPTPSIPKGKLSSTSFDLGIKDPRKDDEEESRKIGTEGRL